MTDLLVGEAWEHISGLKLTLWRLEYEEICTGWTIQSVIGNSAIIGVIGTTVQSLTHIAVHTDRIPEIRQYFLANGIPQ